MRGRSWCSGIFADRSAWAKGWGGGAGGFSLQWGAVGQDRLLMVRASSTFIFFFLSEIKST